MQLRFCICIPVYNHPKTVVQVIDECLLETDHHIIVVDDGSDIDVEVLFKSEASQLSKNERITFIKLPENKGKGFAIQTAIQASVKKGFTHLITIDADGQHLPSEICKLTKAAYENPWAVILGDRQMKTDNVPKSSVFGKAFSNFWIEYQTDKIVGDSQSGFRIYPLFHLQTMSFLTHRYDFEIEVLTRLIWKHVEVKSVSVTVHYFTSDKRVTHFNKFRDNLRLTILNTILVSASLLKRDDPPFKSALATAIGVFVGCLPIYGLHTFIVAIFAFIFRMNFIYLWMGTHISLPPLVPFIILAARYASQLYLHHPPEGVFGLSHDWLVGIFIFATVASFTVGNVVYFLKKSIKSRLKKSHKNISVKSHDGPGVAFMRFALKKFGLKTAYFFLYFIVPYYFIFSLKARRASAEYWKVIRPELSFFQRQLKMFCQLYVFAQILVDRAFQKMADHNQFKVIEGEGIVSFIDSIKNSPKGHIIIQSHVGGWEIAMAYFQHLKLQKKMMAVMYGVVGSYQHSSISKQDKSLEVVHFNLNQDTIIRLKSYLDKGDVVGLMGDRPVGRSYELIPFMGKLALFDSSAIRLSQMCSAEVIFIFCMKEKNNDYSVNTIKAISHQNQDGELTKEQITIQLLTEYASQLEKHIQKNPEQWFNFFPFWSEKTF